MVDIQSVAAEIRRGEKKEEEEEEDRRKKLQGKNIMAPLLYRAAINSISLHSALLGHCSQISKDIGLIVVQLARWRC